MKPEDRRRNILIGITVVVVIALIAFLIIRQSQNSQSTPVESPIPTVVSNYQQELQQNFGITVPDNAIKADLKDVNGGNQMGLATLDKSNGQNEYTVIANLDDPAPGYFYEAWLQNGNIDIVPLGKLSLEKGGWMVNFISTKDLSKYNGVVITLEKIFDNIPEKHILEGSFQ